MKPRPKKRRLICGVYFSAEMAEDAALALTMRYSRLHVYRSSVAACGLRKDVFVLVGSR